MNEILSTALYKALGIWILFVEPFIVVILLFIIIVHLWDIKIYLKKILKKKVRT